MIKSRLMGSEAALCNGVVIVSCSNGLIGSVEARHYSEHIVLVEEHIVGDDVKSLINLLGSILHKLTISVEANKPTLVLRNLLVFEVALLEYRSKEVSVILNDSARNAFHDFLSVVLAIAKVMADVDRNISIKGVGDVSHSFHCALLFIKLADHVVFNSSHDSTNVSEAWLLGKLSEWG